MIPKSKLISRGERVPNEVSLWALSQNIAHVTGRPIVDVTRLGVVCVCVGGGGGGSQACHNMPEVTCL